MKSVLFLVDATLGANVRALKTIRSLARDYHVRVYHRGHLPEDSEFLGIPNTTYKAVPRVLTGFFQRTVFLGRDFTHGFKQVYDPMDSEVPDLTYCVDLWTLPAGAWVCNRTGSKLVYDSYEICAETLSQYYPARGWNARSIFFRLWVGLTRLWAIRTERDLVSRTDLFVTTCDSYLAHFRRRYAFGRALVVRNCPYLVRDIPAIDLRARFDIDAGSQILIYIGWFNEGRRLDLLIEAADHLKSRCHILLLGKGPLAEALERMARGRPGVSVGGGFPMEETLRLIKGADAGILLLSRENLSKYLASANKVFDFMMAGVPMLLSDTPENRFAADLMPTHKIIDDRSPAALAASIDSFFAGGLGTCGTAGEVEALERAREMFCWERQEEVLLTELRRTVSDPGAVA